MRIKAFVVIDTNVLVSAMQSNSKAPFYVLELVEKGNLIPIFDKSVVNGRFCPQSVRRFCPIIAGFNAGTYKVPACVL